MKTQAGFGLSEILISLFLVSIIMTTLIQFYLNNKRQYLAAEEILSEGFDVQWVSDLLSDSIRRAGFTPCLGVDQLYAVDRRNFGKAVLGLKVENQPQQFIQVNRMSENFTQLITIKNTTQIVVANSVLINEQRPLVIADCDHAEIHNILMVDKIGAHQLVTLTKPLMFSYETSAYVGEWLEEHWFIKSNSKGIKALYYQSDQAEELTPLIYSLQIKEKRIHKKKYLEISMGLEKDKVSDLVVAVRGS